MEIEEGVIRRGTNSRCLFYRGVRLIESQIQGVKKGRDQLSVSVLQVSVLQRCPLRESVSPCCSLSLTSLNETPCLKPGGTDRRSDNNKKI